MIIGDTVILKLSMGWNKNNNPNPRLIRHATFLNRTASGAGWYRLRKPLDGILWTVAANDSDIMKVIK